MILPASGHFSKRSDWDRSANPLSQLIALKKASNEGILDLTESNPTRCGFSFYSEFTPLTDPTNQLYEPAPRGLLLARQAVCDYYASKGVPISPEQVFLTSSTSEAYHFLFRLLTNPREAIACAEPSYPLLGTLCELNDVVLKKYTLSPDKHWRLDLSTLREKVRALLVVNPNNPTGNYISAFERKELNKVTHTHGAALISDEVFLDFVREEHAGPATFASNDPVLTFTVSGISKILALPQMKLSWIVVSGPENLRKEALERLEIIADASLSVSTPIQRALPSWLSLRDIVRDEILTRVKTNADVLKKTAAKNGIGEVSEAQGGWYAVLKLSGARTDEETALKWLEKKNVLVHPGYFFDFADESRMVFSLLPQERIFNEAMERLSGGL